MLIGVDLGGTKIAAGLVTPGGELGETLVRPTPVAEGPAAVLDAVTAAVRELPDHQRAQGIGIGTGGVVDRDRGIVTSANQLLPGWGGTDLRTELGDRLGLPVAADNDANAFALAEHHFGAGAGHPDALYVSVGTGIGGGLMLNGRLHRGAHFSAGELGHFPVPEARGRPCPCGIPGHLESVAAGPAIAASYAAGVDLREVARRARAGEPAAVTAIADGATALGRALAGLINVIDVPRVVIGGGVAEIGELFWEPVTASFASHLLPGPAAVRPVPAALGPRSAVIGAAALLLERGPR